MKLVELTVRMLGVDDGYDRVQRVIGGDVFVDEEGLRDWSWISQTSRLDNNPIERTRLCFTSLPQIAEDTNEVAPHSAADAAVVHLDNLLAVTENENIVVDASLPEFILDDGNSLTVPLLKDAVKQRGLSRTEKTGKDRNRHFTAYSGGHCF